MNLYDSQLYNDDVRALGEKKFPWERLSGKSVAISGGTGMIGSFLVDTLMYRNEIYEQNTTIYVFGRNKAKAEERFRKYADNDRLIFVNQDINKPIDNEVLLHVDKIDYVIHGASNTHPLAYAKDPVGTISANVIGTNNLLEWASEMYCERFIFLSSVEVYGENRGDTDKFAEDYLGYIDCNTLRAGYPESKRTGEALCQAYIAAKGLDVVIPRLSRVYGPSMLATDTKALSQFILKGVNKEDIVLKSEGTQEFSYSYVADAVSGIIKVMLDGKKGEAYNIASKDSDVTLKELAGIIADYAGTKVVFELPDAVEQAGYSKATKATLDVGRLKGLGWQSDYDMKTGLYHTIDILREMR